MTAPDPYLTAQDVRDAVTGLTAVNTPDQDPPDYKISDATLERFIARFEALVEGVEVGKGVAYRVRSETETVVVQVGGKSFPVSHTRLGAVTAMTIVDLWGNTIAAPSLAALVPDGRLYRWAAGWFQPGWRVTVTYDHGHASPPPAVIDACIEWVRASAIEQAGSQPRNTTGERTDLGWIPEPTADPSKGRPTKYTIVNDALREVEDECPVLVA